MCPAAAIAIATPAANTERRFFATTSLQETPLKLDHLKNFAVDGDGFEESILTSVAGRGNRETVGAADLQVALDAETQPPQVVGTDSFQFPWRDLSILTLDVDVPYRVRVDVLKLRQDPGQDEFLCGIELSIRGM